MSSALAHPPISLFSEASILDLAHLQERSSRHTEHIERWPSVFGRDSSGSGSASGLHTTTEIRAMAGTSLNLHNPHGVFSHNYYPPRPSYSEHSSRRGRETGQYQHDNNSLGHRNASAMEQPQVRSTDPERENSYAPKNQSGSEYAIASYLQIPASINNSKGSLAEFAAEITCLFWFESAATLQRAEEPSSVADRAVKRLAADAFPSMGFLKWVTTILTTTQVTQNVILLALLFIHRLKTFNPGVSGKKGSEYRLLTVALMLGNKFLDDNTYTNKTWAEVSGISVTEIHIMEVEFLSNMRYNLYVSEEEWKRWQVKLARFSIYFHKASKAPTIEVAKPASPTTPATQTFPYKLPSPPSPARHVPPLPMYQPSLPNPLAHAPHLSHSLARHGHEMDHDSGVRKRSLDVSADMPAAKRWMSNTPASRSPAVPSPASLGAYTPSSNASSSVLADVPNNGSPFSKLPMPNVPSSSAQVPRQYPHLGPLSIPPGRTISTMHPNLPNNWSQPVTPLGTMPPSSINLYANPIPALGEMARGQHVSANSPSDAAYGPVVSRQPSPSYFLTNRNSPYRPVRSVNTLLIPPPSASLQAPTRNVGVEQMRYQPLGKAPAEARAGIVPYMPLEAWPQPWTAASGMHSQFAFHA